MCYVPHPSKQIDKRILKKKSNTDHTDPGALEGNPLMGF
jgi:hypothetical protein